MTVHQLLELLKQLPDHWPVYVAISSSTENGGGADTDYLIIENVESSNFPTFGNMSVIQVKE